MTGPPTACDDAIADLCSALGRSLLQYLDEAGLWTDAAHADAPQMLDRSAAEQRESFADVCDLLDERQFAAELGTYPTEFASLHYLALDFLISRLVADQLAIVALADAAIAACERPAARRLEPVRRREAERFDGLRRLAERLHEPPVN